jgi:hypothetical protein
MLTVLGDLMNAKQPNPEFTINEIPRFDARRGYSRCIPPGVGVSIAMPRSPNPCADFWHDRSGRLVGKMYCRGELFCFESSLASGAPIEQDRMEAFTDYIVKLMLNWITEGIHEVDTLDDLDRNHGIPS